MSVKTKAESQSETALVSVAEASGASAFVRLVQSMVLLGTGIGVGAYQADSTGFLWADAPRYANGAVMIYEWLRSGQWLHPYEFAKSHYIQYPGFSVPFHPPIYPGLMALFFCLFGVSYVSARLFIGFCLGLLGCCFLRLLRQLGASPMIGFSCSLLLITLPEIAYWARTTMSEVPSLLLILFASSLFISWYQTSRPIYCWAMFLVAEMAFLSRLTTAGIVPAWFLYLMVSRQWKRLVDPHLVACSALYLAFNAAWVTAIMRFSRFETGAPVGARIPETSPWVNFLYYPTRLHLMVGWPTLLLALVGVLITIWLIRKKPVSSAGFFWICWFVSYFSFQMMQSLKQHNEPRYFFLALPSVAGLAAFALSKGRSLRIRRAIVSILLTICFVSNVFAMLRIPRGVIGYEAVAQALATRELSGNILSACPRDQDLIFRYTAESDPHSRQFLRGDRTLAVRGPNYGGFKTQEKATTHEHVLKILRKGRVRYVVTSGVASSNADERYPEMKLADEAVRAAPQDFKLILSIPLEISLSQFPRTIPIYLWEYQGELPPGPSELVIPVPTAGMVLKPSE